MSEKARKPVDLKEVRNQIKIRGPGQAETSQSLRPQGGRVQGTVWQSQEKSQEITEEKSHKQPKHVF